MTPEQRKQNQANSMLSNPSNKMVIENLGTEKASALMEFQMECLKIRHGSNLKDVPGLYQRFMQYIKYCADNGIIATNMTCYLACGVGRDMIHAWYTERSGSPEQHNFAVTVKEFLASVRECAAVNGLFNPVYAIFLQKAHDGFSDQPQNDAKVDDPLGEKQSAEQIVEKYKDVDLPD